MIAAIGFAVTPVRNYRDETPNVVLPGVTSEVQRDEPTMHDDNNAFENANG